MRGPILILLLAAASLLFSSPAAGQDPPTELKTTTNVCLAWNAPIEVPGVVITGYRLYWSQDPENYGNHADVGKVLEYCVQDLSPGTWYFVVTALDPPEDGEEQESGPSNQVSMSFSVPGFVEGPLIVDLSATTAELTWKAPVPTTSRIEYRVEDGEFSSVALPDGLTTDHFVRITGLQPQTVYNYEVFDVDQDGNQFSAAGTFETR